MTLSIRRAPERQGAAAFHVPTMDVGFDFQREILARGFRPAVLRQYDSTEAQRMFSAQARGEDALNPRRTRRSGQSLVDAEAAAVAALGQSMGATPADAGATAHWLEQRNHVPSFRQFIENGVVLDTIEIAATWDKVHGIYETAIAGLREVPGHPHGVRAQLAQLIARGN